MFPELFQSTWLKRCRWPKHEERELRKRNDTGTRGDCFTGVSGGLLLVGRRPIGTAHSDDPDVILGLTASEEKTIISPVPANAPSPPPKLVAAAGGIAAGKRNFIFASSREASL